MTTPVRIQRLRTKGWRLQEASRAINGLSAVCVTRPGRWGNPFPTAEEYRLAMMDPSRCRNDADRNTIDWQRKHIGDLRGFNLACWCAHPEPDQPDHCHAAVQMEIANR